MHESLKNRSVLYRAAKAKKPTEHSVFPKNNMKHSALRMDKLRELEVEEVKCSTSANKSGYLVQN